MLPSYVPFLPDTYNVGPNDVIIGRGKKCTMNPGNIRFKSIIQTTLESYRDAETKVRKSEIIMEVLTQVLADNGAGFVKQDSGSGRYIQVEEASCRIAIAQAFRDALSGAYKSSKKHKQIRRLERKRNSAIEAMAARTVAAEFAHLEEEKREHNRRHHSSIDGMAARSVAAELGHLFDDEQLLQQPSEQEPALVSRSIFEDGMASFSTLNTSFSNLNASCDSLGLDCMTSFSKPAASSDSLGLGMTSFSKSPPGLQSAQPGMSLSQLRGILQEASNVVALEDFKQQQAFNFSSAATAASLASAAPPAATATDLFASLYSAFGTSTSAHDPFEPTPMANPVLDLSFNNEFGPKAA